MSDISLVQFVTASKLYTTSFITMIDCEGKAKACEVFKAYLQIAKQIATKDKITPVRFRKSNKEGIPKVLQPLVPFLRGTPNEIRLALTVCRVVEALVLKPNPDWGAITSPPPPLTSPEILGFKA